MGGDCLGVMVRRSRGLKRREMFERLVRARNEYGESYPSGM